LGFKGVADKTERNEEEGQLKEESEDDSMVDAPNHEPGVGPQRDWSNDEEEYRGWVQANTSRSTLTRCANGMAT